MYVMSMFESVHKLKEHEQTDPLRLEELKVLLLKDNSQRNPIIVDKRTLVVIDGHHRLNALKLLDYSKIAVHYVNYYDDEEIEIRTWYPMILGSEKKLMKLMDGKITNTKSRKNTSPQGKLILKNRNYSLKVGRESIMKVLVGNFRIEYAFTSKVAEDLASSGKVAGVLIFNSLSKKEVIDKALSGRKFPPKTTQHIIPNKPRNWYIPLKMLR